MLLLRNERTMQKKLNIPAGVVQGAFGLQTNVERWNEKKIIRISPDINPGYYIN